MFDLIYKITGFISAILGAFAAGIAVYLFLFKRKPIMSIFRLLINYSMNLSLTELKTKLEKLNEFNPSDSQQREDMLNIFHEIIGQIQGNSVLKEKCDTILSKIKNFVNIPKLISETRKRSLVSELRENLRNIELDTYDSIIRR